MSVCFFIFFIWKLQADIFDVTRFVISGGRYVFQKSKGPESAYTLAWDNAFPVHSIIIDLRARVLQLHTTSFCGSTGYTLVNRVWGGESRNEDGTLTELEHLEPSEDTLLVEASVLSGKVSNQLPELYEAQLSIVVLVQWPHEFINGYRVSRILQENEDHIIKTTAAAKLNMRVVPYRKQHLPCSGVLDRNV